MRAFRIFFAAHVALLIVPALACATITPEAKAVIDRYFEAAGGRSAWDKKRVVHFTGSLTAYGMQGTIEGWRKGPDKEANVAVVGPFTIRDWADGNRITRTDPSGKLVRVDGKELEDAIGGVWFDNDCWLQSDQGGGSIAVARAMTDSSKTVTVLEVQPPSGRKAYLEFDRKSGLVVRSRTRRDQVDIVASNSDFRKVDGWTTAFKTVQEVPGMPANTVTIQVEHVDFPADNPDERFAPPSTSESGLTWLKTNGTAHIPFQYIGRHVWLRVAINGGAPADFMFDTGASVSVIDSTYAAAIGLKTSGSIQAMGGASSSGRASFGTLDVLRVVSSDQEGVELHGLKVAVINVNQMMQPFFFRPCAGIVGFDVIGQLITRIDFDKSEITFVDPQAFKYDGKGTALPMTLAGGVPTVNIKVDGAYEGGARVDIGSDSVLDLHTPFVKKNDLLAKVDKSIVTAHGGVGGMFESRLARMKSIEIGPYRIAEPLVGLSSTDQGVLASEDYAGNIGNGLLERFIVTLDYERRQLWLEPGARYAKRDHLSMLGVQFAKVGDDFRVAQVLEGSAGEHAGLVVGDTVTMIDGRPVTAMDREALDRQFENGKPGTKVAITVIRDGKPKKLTAKLKDTL